MSWCQQHHHSTHQHQFTTLCPLVLSRLSSDSLHLHILIKAPYIYHHSLTSLSGLVLDTSTYRLLNCLLTWVPYLRFLCIPSSVIRLLTFIIRQPAHQLPYPDLHLQTNTRATCQLSHYQTLCLYRLTFAAFPYCSILSLIKPASLCTAEEAQKLHLKWQGVFTLFNATQRWNECIYTAIAI